MLYLYNPINNVKTPTTYEKVSGYTGLSQENLRSYKCKNLKISSINSYLIDENTSIADLREFMQKEKIKGEIWKYIEGHENYKISDYGRIIKIYKTKERIMMPYIKKGIKRSKNLFIKINGKEVLVHKLVANAFLDFEEGKVVFHKNGNITDNYAGNLEYIALEKMAKKTAWMSKGIPVLKIDPITLEILESYDSMATAGRENYLHRESIRGCVSGKSKTSGGYIWKIDEEFYNSKLEKRDEV